MKPHLLIVEDEQDITDLISLGLRGHYEISSVTGLSGLRVALADSRPDVIILDLNLPDSVGEDTMRAVQTICPHIPVVVFSSHSDPVATIHLGAQDHITKGAADFDRIKDALVKAMARHHVRSHFAAFKQGVAKVELVVKEMRQELDSAASGSRR